MPRILVLEDSQYLRLLSALRLAAHGHVVVAAPDSSDGLKQVQASDPDLIMKNPHLNPLDAGRPRASSVQDRACVSVWRAPKNSSGKLSESLRAKPKVAKAARLQKLRHAPAPANCVSSV